LQATRCASPEAAAALPVLGRATPEGTARFVAARRLGVAPKALGATCLQVAPVGFGCHRLEDTPEQINALQGAIRLGCNLIDVAPGYTDGAAERAVGCALRQLIAAGQLARDEVVVVTKVGNIVGSSLGLASAMRSADGIAKVRDDVWHCLEPAWIEQELTRSLDRLGLECVDCLLLHCPEFATRAPGVDMDEVYRRIRCAFSHLEEEVSRGRVARYGVTAAFYPLRSSDPEHLLLERVLEQLPSQGHHFQVIQFALNFAEPQPLWVGHTPRRLDGAALDPGLGVTSPPLLELARRHGLATLTNRPLDGLLRELRGVLRFASEVPMNGEMKEEDVDALEERLTALCGPSLGDPGEPVVQQLAAKTVKVLVSLAGVDCVLVGMRRPQHVIDVVRLLKQAPPLDDKIALDAVKSAHDAINMWFCMDD